MISSDDLHSKRREMMVVSQLQSRGILDSNVLHAMRTIPRHRFVPDYLQDQSYHDCPLPIGHDQTISQPYIVALMTELLQIRPTDRILEIGTGSGYQTAVLASLCQTVYSIEIVPSLQIHCKAILDDLNFRNICFMCSDGSNGWPDAGPFDGIIITCAPDRLPDCFASQLIEHRHIVAPVGTHSQNLMVYTRHLSTLSGRLVIPVRFVPMIIRS